MRENNIKASIHYITQHFLLIKIKTVILYKKKKTDWWGFLWFALETTCSTLVSKRKPNATILQERSPLRK